MNRTIQPLSIMMWNEKLIAPLEGAQIINDSKTPSGTVHVGSLRGVLVHDAIYRALQGAKIEAKFIFGIDDYDPLDGLPHDAEPWLQEYMGHPLCNVPAPKGSVAKDMADHYIADFLNIFKELKVDAEFYRTRDLYRSGQFDEAIDLILKNAAKVREIYRRVSHSERLDTWHPFQIICEKCGSLGTTEVDGYDGQVASYTCKPDLVSWAQGCGYEGQISPFLGNGKLPWKLEWAAKWHTMGVSIEGAGKDHCTKGGSHDVSAACLREIFHKKPPLKIPYEFFLIGGAKMSSSKGVGTSARDMADLLPPEILRFLIIRTTPKKTVNFSTDLTYMVKLYNEYDKLCEAVISGKSTDEQQQMMKMLEIEAGNHAYHPVGFQVLTALLQLPHLDVEKEINKRSDGNQAALKKRLNSARYWLEHFLDDADRVVLQESMPASAKNLSQSQRAFLNKLTQMIPSERIDEDGYQRLIFSAARQTPIPQTQAFLAIYRVLLDKEQGPKGGALFSYLDIDFLKDRFSNLSFAEHLFWQESAQSLSQAQVWFEKQKNNISNCEHQAKIANNKIYLEISVATSDQKIHMLRIAVDDADVAINQLSEFIDKPYQQIHISH